MTSAFLRVHVGRAGVMSDSCAEQPTLRINSWPIPDKAHGGSRLVLADAALLASELVEVDKREGEPTLRTQMHGARNLRSMRPVLPGPGPLEARMGCPPPRPIRPLLWVNRPRRQTRLLWPTPPLTAGGSGCYWRGPWSAWRLALTSWSRGWTPPEHREHGRRVC